MSPVKKPPPEPEREIHVPGHLIPRRCSMCHYEIVRVPTKEGLVHVDYSTVKHRAANQSQTGGYHGYIHNCPATCWEPKEKR